MSFSWKLLGCDDDNARNAMKYAIIMSIVSRLHYIPCRVVPREIFDTPGRYFSHEKIEMTECFCFLCNKTHNQIFSFMRHLKTWKKNSQTVISGYLLSGSADDKISRGHGGRHFITTLSMIMMSSYRVV